MLAVTGSVSEKERNTFHKENVNIALSPGCYMLVDRPKLTVTWLSIMPSLLQIVNPQAGLENNNLTSKAHINITLDTYMTHT